MSYQDEIRKFVNENFLYEEDSTITADTSLLGLNVIDSTGVLELVVFLEEAYGITLDDHERVPENLDTIKNIDRFLKKKIAAKQQNKTEVAKV